MVVKDLCNENRTTVMQKIEDNTNKEKYIYSHGLKTKYYKNIHTTQCDLQNQFNSYHIPMALFTVKK